MSKGDMLISKIRELINLDLTKLGFEKIDKDEEANNKVYERWVRDKTWKIEDVRMIYPKQDPYFIWLVLDVYLKYDDGTEMLLCGETVNNYVGKNNVWYQFPSFLLRFRQTGFINEIINDLGNSLSWYNRFETPEDCVAEIEAERTNIAKDGRKYKEAINFLEKIQVTPIE